jgi:hypothetical protein
MAWYGLVWLGMAWCSGTFKLMSKSWRSGLEMPHAGWPTLDDGHGSNSHPFV